MMKYKMTDAEKETFLSGDEGRGEIRLKASKAFPQAETIQIIDSENDLFGEVTGAEFEESTDFGLAVVPTDEQLELKRTEDALLSADTARLEDEIKPLVFAKLKDEARNELRAEYGATIRSLRAEKAELKSQVGRLTEGVTALTKQVESLKTENALLKSSAGEGEQFEQPVSAEPRSQL